MHTAPGHGREDYLTGLRHNLVPVLSPVDDSGCFTADAGPFLAGLEVLTAGTSAVIGQLAACGALLKEVRCVHKYPYDWRTKQPTIFRSTCQWFANVSVQHQAELLASLDSVQWVPGAGKNRIAGADIIVDVDELLLLVDGLAV